MSEQVQKPAPKVPTYVPIKYFLSSVNTFFGRHLISRLRNDSSHPNNHNRIVGTIVANNNQQVPEGVRKVVDTGKIKFFEQVLLTSDVIIYDLTTCDLKQAEFIITTLKTNPFEGEKLLICVSNVMTWARSKPKVKREDEEQGQADVPEEPDSEEENAPEAVEGEDKKQFVRFTDKDYALRKPALQFEEQKSIETLCLAAGSVKDSLKTYVVCSGVLYGAGENLLADYFMQARLQKPEKLPYYGNGKNRIPMVHIADLLTYIQKIIEKRPKIPYVLALDYNPKPTQKRIIEAISSGIGTAKVESNQITVEVKNIDLLTLNLRMKPTTVFAKIEEEEAALEQEEGNQTPKFKFVWRAKEGVDKSIQSLRKEYNAVHNLSQEKVLIIGPPGSGKTYYSSKLAEKYDLPHIHVKGVLKEMMSLQNQLGEEIRTFMADKKQSQVAAKQAEYDQLKQKWKKIPKEQRDVLQPFDPDKVDVRLSDELLYKCYKWRITQNDCLNRGYILDGYPRSYNDATQIFMWVPPSEGEDGNENTNKTIDQRVVPSKFIALEMSDEAVLQALQNLSEETIAGTHLNKQRINLLLKRYRTLHNAETGEYILEDFFKENHIPCHHITVSKQTDSILESLIKPLPLEQEKEKAKVLAQLQKAKKSKQQAMLAMQKKQTTIRNIQNEDYMMKKQNEQNEQRQILDKKSLALRKYLDVNLVPVLSQGIAEILRTFPSDPVDMLAKFLFKNSLKVPNPDPSTFEF